MAVLGVALTAIARSSDTASTVAPFAAVILSFVSGVFLPVEILPGWLRTFGEVFPLYPLADGLRHALLGDGTGLAATNVLVLAAWMAGGLVVAARGFRWEPQAGGR